MHRTSCRPPNPLVAGAKAALAPNTMAIVRTPLVVSASMRGGSSHKTVL